MASTTISRVPWPTRKRFLVLAVFCSLTFLTYLDRICIMREQDDIARDLRFGELTAADEQLLRERGQTSDAAAREKLREGRARSRFAWVFSAFVWGYILFEIPGGWMGDRWGPRVVITRIVIWWSIFTALTGSVDSIASWLSPDPSVTLLLAIMVLTRFLFGAGEAGAFPNIGRALAGWFPFEHRGSAMGAIWLCSRLGGALAPIIIGRLVDMTGDWRRAFGVLGIAGVVWAVLFHLWYRDRPDELHGVNESELSLIQGCAIHRASAASLHGCDAPAAVPWQRLAASPGLWCLCLSSAAMTFGWYFYITFLPGYLKDRFHVSFQDSELMSGLPLLVGGIACLAGGRVSDWLIRRTGSRRWGRSILGMAGLIGAGLCVMVVNQLHTGWDVIIAICFAAALQDLAVPCFWSTAIDIGGRFAGTVSGTMNSFAALAGALSPLVVARVTTSHDWSAAFWMFAVSYLVGGLLWLRIDASESLDKENP